MADDGVWVGAHVADGTWLAVAFDREGFDHAATFDGIGDLWFRYEDDAAAILADVPIGLLDEADGGRECDALARSIVGPRAEEILAPPARKALRKRRYPVASRTHERATGESLSERAFELSETIATVDQLLREFSDARDLVSAAHPEVAFVAFAGERMEYDRGTAGGYAERLRTLASIDRDAPPAVQAAATAVGESAVTVADVLDATALAYTALPHEGRLRSLPPQPPLDANGLPMEIVYRSTAPLVEASE
jgi:predicted RNase H-like nuclease